MKVFIDPVYYHNPRGIGVVTRKIHDQIKDETECTLLLNEPLARLILRYPIFFFIWEQIFVPFYLWIAKIDLYFATGGTAPILKPRSTKQVLWVHDLYFLEVTSLVEGNTTLRKRLGKAYRKILIQKILNNSQKVIAISKFTRERILKLTGFSGEVQVIYNYVDEPNITSDPNDKENICIIFTGASPNKNPIFVTSVLALLSVTPVELRVVVLGLPQSLQRSYTGVEYHDFLPQSQLNLLLRKSKFCLVPSTYEGFGLPIVEAAFNDCVPLSTDILIFQEINPFFCRVKPHAPETAVRELHYYMAEGQYKERLYEAKNMFRYFNTQFMKEIKLLIAQNA